MSYEKLINDKEHSFSSLDLYDKCPYAFYKKYIEKDKDVAQNFFAANGSAMHKVFEHLLKKKITLAEAPELYEEEYSYIDSIVSQKTMDTIYEKCMDYLCEVDDLDPKYEIIGVELKLHFKIGGYKFTGFVDCLLRNKETGDIILVDHKSSDHFLKKDGTPLKSSLDSFLAYKHQMYLYCKGLKDCMGLNVDKIVWHHFKDGGKLTVIPFVQRELDETIEWAVDTIEKIKKDDKFESSQSFMMCSKLCDYRFSCEYLVEDD